MFSPFKFKRFPAKTRAFTTSLSSLLDLCNTLEIVHQVHARFILHGLHQNPTLSSKLINAYANLGHLDISLTVFYSVSDPNSLLYNTIIRKFSAYGNCERTLLFYHQMLLKSMYPDEFTYPFVLKSCHGVSALESGMRIHCHVVKLGFESDVHVGNALVEMYGRCGEFNDAHNLFDGMSVRNSVCLSTLICEQCEDGEHMGSFTLLKRMILEGFVPDLVTVVCLLRSSVDLKSLEAGRFVHLLIVLSSLEKDLAVNTALLTMYCKLGKLETSRLLFEKMPVRDCVVWNIMISAYSRNGYPEKALELLIQMGKSGVRTDLFTAIAVISSAAKLKSLKQAKQIHAHVIRNGSNYQASVQNSLIEMYSNCGSLEPAKQIFNLLTNKTVVSWSSMIKGYVNHDRPSDALSLFSKMRTNGMNPDSITVINILPACVHIGTLNQVKILHGYSIRHGLNSVISVVTALLVSYAKCGYIEMAQKLFDVEGFADKDIVSWNSMISAYSKHGNWSRCFELYNQMKVFKVKPDQMTFIGLLTACVNSGLVKEGWDCFNEMTQTYCLQPEQEHYACMVDLLGRTGHPDEAVKLIKTMPFKPDSRVWGPLLSSCKMNTDTRLAEFAAENLIKIEPKNAGNYVLLSNIYAAAGKWDGVAKMRGFLRDRGLKKTPGCSWLEINGRVHEFRVADRSHPKSEDIYAILRNMELEIKLNTDMSLELLT